MSRRRRPRTQRRARQPGTLRTPLVVSVVSLIAVIRGYAELTRRGREEQGPDTRHALRSIESEAGRMPPPVEDLLLLARLGAGRPLQLEQTDLVPPLVDTISAARAAGTDHTWRLELPDEPAFVSADAARLQQVLVNLLANAHTPPARYDRHRTRAASRAVAVRGGPGRRAGHPAGSAAARLPAVRTP